VFRDNLGRGVSAVAITSDGGLAVSGVMTKPFAFGTSKRVTTVYSRDTRIGSGP